MQSWGPGNGIYLGRGLVLTAAHVVGRTFWTRPKVIVADHELATQTIREGSLEGTDLTLLRIDEKSLPISLALRLNPICKTDPAPGQEVAAVIRSKIVYSRVLSPAILPPNARRFQTIIGDVATTASSGAGVFDLRRKCLLGIVSRKISGRVGNQMRDLATYFVPAAEIRVFIPPQFQ